MEIRTNVVDRAYLINDTSIVKHLLSRTVNYEPFAAKTLKVKPHPLPDATDATTTRIQEALIVKDLLNILIGLDGNYIRFTSSYSPTSDSSSFPQFEIAKNVDKSLKDFYIKMSVLAKYYICLKNKMIIWSDQKFGSVINKFGQYIRDYLNNTYLSFIVNDLEYEFKEKKNFSITYMYQLIKNGNYIRHMECLYVICEQIETEISNRMKNNNIRDSNDIFGNNPTKRRLTLKEFEENIRKNSNILNNDNGFIYINPNINNLPKGGVILKIIQRIYTANLGDKVVMDFMKNVLNEISVDYVKNLYDWLINGEINDPFNEFFIINENKDARELLYNGTILVDNIWDTQYSIRIDGLLDKFVTNESSINNRKTNDRVNHTSLLNGINNSGNNNNNNNDLLSKIFMTGKMLNVIKICYETNELPMNIDNNNELEYLNLSFNKFNNFVEIMDVDSKVLDEFVDKCYLRANQLFFNMFVKDYNSFNVLRNIFTHFVGYTNSNNVFKFLKNNIRELSVDYQENMIPPDLITNFNNQKGTLLLSERYSKDIILSLLAVKLDDTHISQVIPSYIDYDFEKSFPMEDLDSNNNTNQSTSQLIPDEIHKASNGTNASTTNQIAPIHVLNIHHLKFEMFIPYPLNILISRSCIIQIQIISRYMYLINYYNILMNDAWHDMNTNPIWRFQKFHLLVKKNIITRTQINHNKMMKFLENISYYLNHKLINNELDNFFSLEAIQESANNTDRTISVNEITNKLQEILTNITSNCIFLNLSNNLLNLLDLFYRYCRFIRGIRRNLCQLDEELFERNKSYVNRLEPNDPELDHIHFNPDNMQTVYDNLLGYILKTEEAFKSEKNSFIQGINYYKDKGKVEQISPLSTLIDLLS
ncbi:hypothetical protein TBLA_0C06640 [Henningerozyma blattae CBS 6284]|uniref:Spindle pole body component n=1 Tax=Henningerozyma blattae (strain ATCC 34711 / CBS 6284 / DSM 70876 / NBRC 10599 / NRRL Y-10934 / UCD 77-7) TaxID=1071380 RepID=I2H255_HENB6|nr:hypothetical protein TBLA_0C06640 [Tetrapisispora blattae CBS 6284]CCH60457.1 hypothetical protein TBLA_0C06640 [Tetrapisispora blattae CBS 6284]